METLNSEVFENIALHLTNDVLASIRNTSVYMNKLINKIIEDGWHWKLKLEDYLSSIVGYDISLRVLTQKDNTSWKHLYDTVVNTNHLADIQDPLIQEMIVQPYGFASEDYVVDEAIKRGDVEAVKKALKVIKSDSLYDDTIFTTFLMGNEEIMKVVFSIVYDGKYMSQIENAIKISERHYIDLYLLDESDALDYLIYRCAYFGNTAVLINTLVWVNFDHDFGGLVLFALEQGHFNTAKAIINYVITEGCNEFNLAAIVDMLQEPEAQEIVNILMNSEFAEELMELMENTI